jgi:hypothetical protein
MRVRTYPWWFLLLAIGIGGCLVVGNVTVAPLVYAEDGGDDEGDEDCDLLFEDVDFFIEINSTDGDAGVQLNLDGEGWKKLKIEGPGGRTLLRVKAKQSIEKQGLTEFFFESAEPSFEDQPLKEFLELFPEGWYTFEGVTTEGAEICTIALLTHDLPAGPEIDANLDGDGNLVISWTEVTESFDHPGAPDRPIEIESYEVIASVGDGEFRALLGPDDRQVTVPPEVLAHGEPGDEVKYEVLAKEASGNQTLSERLFIIPPS